MQTETFFTSRRVDDHGETLVVREHNGRKVLCDPCDEGIVVVVPSGRRAKIVRYAVEGLCGRDACTVVTYTSAGLVFVCERHPIIRVALRDLSAGQLVDVFPAAEPAAVYAHLPRILPVLHGAVAQPIYAYACA